MRWSDRLIHQSASAEIDAAAQMLGDAVGQAMFGAAHHLGAGVPRDAVRAYTLLLSARARGSTITEPFIDAARKALPDHQAAKIERAASAQAAKQVA